MIQQSHFWVYMERIESRVSKRYLCTQVHSSIIHSRQKVEATHVSIHRWMDKQNVYLDNGILFILKKEENANMLQHEGTLYIMLSETSQSQKRQTVNDST